MSHMDSNSLRSNTLWAGAWLPPLLADDLQQANHASEHKVFAWTFARSQPIYSVEAGVVFLEALELMIKVQCVRTPDDGIDVGQKEGDAHFGAFRKAVCPACNVTGEGLRSDAVGDRDGRGETSDLEDVPQNFVLVLQIQGVPNGAGID